MMLDIEVIEARWFGDKRALMANHTWSWQMEHATRDIGELLDEVKRLNAIITPGRLA